MALVLSAKNNPNYGGCLVSQKYSPLADIQLLGPRTDYAKLFTKRISVLDGMAAYPPCTLYIYGNLPAFNADPVPMVVISSNRAGWMQTVLQNAVDHGPFDDGYLDATTFAGGWPVAWYAPERSGGRPVYVLVHWSEYNFYVQELAAFAGVTVVGFKFGAPHPALDIVGLGACRCAALQFLIARGYHRAWLVDDNVININGFPATPVPIENHMGVGSNIWGIGFTGTTQNIVENALYGKTKFVAAQYDFAKMKPGLLQQTALWNVDLFRRDSVNFCPLFVTSNEDIAFCNYLQANNLIEKEITACSIIKFQPYSDGDDNVGGSVEVPLRRNRLVEIFSGIEGDIPFVPVDGHGERPLSQYITETVLPNAQDTAQSTAPVVQSKAVEQVMAAGTTKRWYPEGAFNPYPAPADVQFLLPADVPPVGLTAAAPRKSPHDTRTRAAQRQRFA